MGQYSAMIRVIACIVAASVCCAVSFNIGTRLERLKTLLEERDKRAELVEKFNKEQARSAALNEQVRELLDRPAAKDTVRTVIRENPSNCARPEPVTNSLRAEVDRANQAIAASRNGDSLQVDPAGK